jgi:gas vesicle protein
MALGIVLGTVAGLGLGVLVAPRSGEETRGRLREHAMATKEKAREQMARKREAAMDAMNRTKQAGEEAKEQAVSRSRQASTDNGSTRTGRSTGR